MVFTIIFFILIGSMNVMTSCNPHQSNYKINKPLPLAKDPDVIYWEIIDDSLHVYRKSDSIIDEIERWKYIRSLEHDSLWE